DQAQVLARGVALDLHLGRERGILGGHLDALTAAVVLPAVVEAAQAVALHPAGAELRAPGRAAEGDDVGHTPRAAVEREILADDTDGLRVAGLELAVKVDRLPEPAHEAPGERPGPYVRAVGRGGAVLGSCCWLRRDHDAFLSPGCYSEPTAAVLAVGTMLLP